VALAHLALGQLFDRQLDPRLHCYELFQDHERFASVGLDDMRPGDLVWFGYRDPKVPLQDFEPEYNDSGYLMNWQDFAVNHVAIYTGSGPDGEALLLHASPTDGTNAVWPLDRFAEHTRYGQVYRVSRLVLELV